MLIRNPSLFGEATRFLAVGFALIDGILFHIDSPVDWLLKKVWRQEPQLVEIFGDDYVDYQKNVPLFIPWTYFFKRNKTLKS